NTDAGHAMTAQVDSDELAHGDQPGERSQSVAAPGADAQGLRSVVDRRAAQPDDVVPRFKDGPHVLAWCELVAQRPRRLASLATPQGTAEVEKIDGRHREVWQPESHRAVDLMEALHPRLGEDDLLLLVDDAVSNRSEPARVDVKARRAIRAHSLQFAVQPRAEVDVGRPALKLADLLEQVILRRQPGVGALVARKGLERYLIGMDRDDRVEQQAQLVLVLVDEVEVRQAGLVEGPQPGVAGVV